MFAIRLLIAFLLIIVIHYALPIEMAHFITNFMSGVGIMTVIMFLLPD